MKSPYKYVYPARKKWCFKKYMGPGRPMLKGNGFDTPEEARDALSEAEALILKDDDHTKHKHQTVSALKDKYIANCRGAIEEQSAEKYYGTLTRNITKKYGDLSIKDFIQEKLLQDIRDDLKGKSTNTYLRTRSCLSRMLDYGIALHWVTSDDLILFNKVFAPVTDENKNTTKNKNYCTHKQALDFIKKVKTHHNRWGMWFEFAFMTGCRIGEQRAVKIEDIDFEEGTIHIHTHAVDSKWLGGSLILDSTKTSAGNRYIPMSKSLKKDLLVYIKEKGLKGGDLLFSGRDGGILCKHVINKAWRDYLKKYKMPYKYTFTHHSARHCFITWFLEQPNLSIQILSQFAKIVGHKSPKTMIEIYQHIHEKPDEKVIGFIDNL